MSATGLTYCTSIVATLSNGTSVVSQKRFGEPCWSQGFRDHAHTAAMASIDDRSIHGRYLGCNALAAIASVKRNTNSASGAGDVHALANTNGETNNIGASVHATCTITVVDAPVTVLTPLTVFLRTQVPSLKVPVPSRTNAPWPAGVTYLKTLQPSISPALLAIKLPTAQTPY